MQKHVDYYTTVCFAIASHIISMFVLYVSVHAHKRAFENHTIAYVLGKYKAKKKKMQCSAVAPHNMSFTQCQSSTVADLLSPSLDNPQ